jgi:hypothetical protein
VDGIANREKNGAPGERFKKLFGGRFDGETQRANPDDMDQEIVRRMLYRLHRSTSRRD